MFVYSYEWCGGYIIVYIFNTKEAFDPDITSGVSSQSYRKDV